jgi:uncharacterized membrane protein
MLKEKQKRIQSIDVLRGLVMVIMALDHVRDFLYRADLTKAADAAMDPTNMETTYPALFFTRWITHFCAPIFIFLAGTSIYMMGQRLTKNELSIFLLKRGLWLVILEVTIITFGWTFNPMYNILILQVIWAIGASMILFGLLIKLSYKVIFGLGLLIVVGHNVMDFPSVGAAIKGNILMEFLYSANFSFHAFAPNHYIAIIYSFLPWMGVMLLGYCFGRLFEANVEATYRRKVLVNLGLAIIASFLILRFSNLYGDPLPWSSQPRGLVYTFLSFLNLNKYPPSLLFICMTLGPAMLILAWFEKIQNRFTSILNIYGRVPMLYYVLHFYFIHIITVVVFFMQGFGMNDIISPNNPFFFKPNGIGFNLWGVYAVWILVVALLFPICKKFSIYKGSHKQWWLSYL